MAVETADEPPQLLANTRHHFVVLRRIRRHHSFPLVLPRPSLRRRRASTRCEASVTDELQEKCQSPPCDRKRSSHSGLRGIARRAPAPGGPENLRNARKVR